jgi:hypothetical protein
LAVALFVPLPKEGQMRKLLTALGAVAAVSLLLSGITKHSDHGVPGVVSNASWAAFLLAAATVLVVGAATLVRAARS